LLVVCQSTIGHRWWGFSPSVFYYIMSTIRYL
jgi:hypothetical protein